MESVKDRRHKLMTANGTIHNVVRVTESATNGDVVYTTDDGMTFSQQDDVTFAWSSDDTITLWDFEVVYGKEEGSKAYRAYLDATRN